MDDYIKKIYELLYLPILTPYNILENAKLDNYSYVKYYKGNIGLIAEMRCNINGEGEAIFYYHFDNFDKLDKVEMKQGRKKSIVFDRKADFESLKGSYMNNYGKSIKCEVG